MKTLLIIDVQNDFLPGGSLAVPKGGEIIQEINEIMTNYDLIVATKDWHPSDHISFASNHSGNKDGDIIKFKNHKQILWPDHCIQDSFGSEFPSGLYSDKINKIIYKGKNKDIDSYSAFFDNLNLTSTDLFEFLKDKKVEKIDIVGLATEYCVKFSALDSLKLGFYTRIISKCVRGLNDDNIKNALDEMRSKGIVII